MRHQRIATQNFVGTFHGTSHAWRMRHQRIATHQKYTENILIHVNVGAAGDDMAHAATMLCLVVKPDKGFSVYENI